MDMLKKLPNGLTVYVKKVPGNGVTVNVTCKVGSVNEIDGQRGYSHFVEHMLFEGTTKRPDAEKIASTIENVGGEINAMTSNEVTTYYVKTLPKHCEKAIDVLSDMVMHPLFEESKVKKEAVVISEEIKMINDQPRYFQWLVFEKALFKGTPFALPVYGLTEDVMNATAESLRAYYVQHYGPENCVVTIVGNVSDEVYDLVSKYFGSWSGTPSQFLSQNKLPKNTIQTITAQKAISQLYLIHGCVTPHIKTKEAAVFDIIEALLGRSQSGWINDEIRNKKGLGYDVGVSYETLHEFGFFAINVGTDVSKKDEVLSLIQKVLNRLQNVTEEELAIAKSYVEGRTLLELESTSRYADVLSYWIQVFGDDFTAEYLARVNAVTVKDIAEVSSRFFSEMTTIFLEPQ